MSKVTVVPTDGLVAVDGEMLFFDVPLPDDMQALHALQWDGESGHTEWTDGPNQPLTPADYDTQIAPFVIAWQAEKVRREEAAAKPATLEEARAAALARLGAAFAAAEEAGKVTSSAGFVIDATERSNRDIEGLITSMEAGGTQETTFCAADNSFHSVTLDQLKTMRLEVIAYGQALYARKWELRTAIESAQSVEAVQAVDINFDGVSA